MSLYIASINSGSNGNCYYVGNEKEGVLIDAGISCKETEIRMANLGLQIQKLKAIFITHEHTDHIKGLTTLSKKYQLPVYITPLTYKHCHISLPKQFLRNFTEGNVIEIGDLQILPFSKSHDANDPHSFMISCNNVHVGVITDIGYACKHVTACFKKCDAVFLESNYCENMLANGTYPPHLKHRISSDKGHLSNNQALELFQNHKSENLQLLILSHLSKNNNTPELVNQLFTKYAKDVQIVVASRYRESALFCVQHNKIMQQVKKKNSAIKNENQLTLF